MANSFPTPKYKEYKWTIEHNSIVAVVDKTTNYAYSTKWDSMWDIAFLPGNATWHDDVKLYCFVLVNFPTLEYWVDSKDALLHFKDAAGNTLIFPGPAKLRQAIIRAL